MKLLTIAVPAYNIEKYIDECLSSFLCAEARGDVEIIIVNDGSSDATESIALAYRQKHPGLFKVHTKANGGHGSAVNAGIALAEGKYFKVIDGDDWVDGESFLAYLDILSGCDADMVATDFCCVSAEEHTVKERRSPLLGGSAEGLYAFDDIADRLLVRMHSATYKTAILKDRGITLDEHCFYVDMEYNSFPIPYVESTYIAPLPVYMYRLGLGGQSVSMVSMRKNVDMHETVLHRLLAHLDSRRDISAAKQRYLARMAAEMVSTQMLIFLSFPPKKSHKQRAVALDKALRQEHPEVYSACRNKALLAIRRSSYLLYSAASLTVRLTRK